MKVIQELVAYFDRRGKLSRTQVRSLLDSGYLAAEALLARRGETVRLVQPDLVSVRTE